MAKQKEILVIEDNKILAYAIEAGLTENLYSVSLAYKFAEGERLAKEKRFDVIILDLGLPCKPPEEVILSIKDFAPVPVIVLTGRKDEKYGHEAFEHGATGFAYKPITIAQLIGEIESAYRFKETTQFVRDSIEESKKIKLPIGVSHDRRQH